MKRPVGQLIAILWGQQLGLLCLIVGCLWGFDPFDSDGVIAYSVFLGGLIYWIPNAYFTLFAFRYRGTQAARAVLYSFYRGEFGKMLLTAMGFAVVFVFIAPLSYLAVFLAYAGMTVSQWCIVSRWM